LVLSISDGVVTISGLPRARMGEVLLIQPDYKRMRKIMIRAAKKDEKAQIDKMLKETNSQFIHMNKLPPKLPLNAYRPKPALAVILNLEYTQIKALLLDQFSDVRENYIVYRQYRRLSTIVGDLNI